MCFMGKSQAIHVETRDWVQKYLKQEKEAKKWSESRAQQWKCVRSNEKQVGTK